MTREEMMDSIATLVRDSLVAGHYVNSDKGEPASLGANFCFEHANMVAGVSALDTGVDTWVDSTGSGADGHRSCEFYGCDRHLDFGGLTDHGIDNALGLTEAEPLECHVYPSELVLAASSMMIDDPRWDLWDRQAARVIHQNRRRRRSAR